MQLRFTQMLAALRHALAFVDEYASKFPDIVSGGARAALNQAIDALAAQAVAQAAHRLGHVGQRESERQLARTLRRRHINPLVRIARLAVPEVAQLAAVRVPLFRSNSTDLATKAFAMADAAQPYEASLTSAGLRAGFADAMRTAARALLDAVAGKKSHVRARVGATGAIDRQVDACRRVMNAMDSLVKASLVEQDPLLVEWRSVVRDFRGTIAAVGAPETADAPPVDDGPMTPTGPALVAG